MTVAGLITGLQVKRTKKGDLWAIATVEDLAGAIECLFFPTAYMTMGPLLQQDTVAVVRGKVNRRDDTVSIYAQELTLPDVSDGPRGPVVVTMETSRATAQRVEELKVVLTNHPGTTEVHLRLVKPGRVVEIRLDTAYRVNATEGLFGDLKVLLGPALPRLTGARPRLRARARRVPHTVTPMPSHRLPTAERRPHVREHHGHRFEDPYAWMRDTEDPAFRAHLEAENAYAEAHTAHLAPLRKKIYEEIRSRVKETDLSVPVMSGPWWYYARTVEGRQYPSHVRAPLVDKAVRPDPEADAVPGEQVVLDGNVEAGESEFFSIGALTVSADHRLVAFAVDTAGDERFDATVRVVETGEVLDTSLTGIGYGCEFSRDGRFLFYTRLDDAWRPYQVWRHRVGGDPSDDVLIHEEADDRFWMGVSSSRDERWLLIGLGSKTTSEVHLLDADDPEGDWRVVAPRREGVEYDVEPAGDRLLIVHNTDTADADLAWAPIDATSAEQWVPWLRSSQGERFVSVDAFDRAAVLSLRSGGLTALRVLPRDATSASGYGDPWDVPVEQPVHSIGLGDNPEPDQDAIQVVVESWVTPRTVLDVDLTTGDSTLLKRQPVLGGVDLADYTERREWATVQTAPSCRCPSSTTRASSRTAPTPVSSRHTVRMRSPRTRTSPSPASACSTAESSTPWRTCVGEGRWVAGGTTRASSTPSPRRSLTPSPRSTTSSRPVGWPATASDSRVGRPAGCSSARCSTSPLSASAWPTPPCPSSTP